MYEVQGIIIERENLNMDMAMDLIRRLNITDEDVKPTIIANSYQAYVQISKPRTSWIDTDTTYRTITLVLQNVVEDKADDPGDVSHHHHDE